VTPPAASARPVIPAAAPKVIAPVVMRFPLSWAPAPRVAAPVITQKTLQASAPLMRVTLVLAAAVNAPVVWKMNTAFAWF